MPILPRLIRASLIVLCGTGAFAPAFAEPQQLSRDDVEQIIAQAVTAANRKDYGAIIAVTDRDGFLLGLWDVKNRVPSPLPAFSLTDKAVIKTYGLVAGAITRASTAAFLSSNQNAFTSRTAGFIIQQHFPPGVRNTSPGPLVGVGFSNLFYSDVNRVKLVFPGFDGGAKVADTTSPGARTSFFPLTSLNDSPGGVPLYKDGELVGGIGVTGDNDPTNLAPAAAIFFKETQRTSTTGYKTGEDNDELVALAGQTGYRPENAILATNVILGGIRVPYVDQRPEDIEDVHTEADLTGGNGRAIDVPDPAGTGLVALGAPKASPEFYPYEKKTMGGFDGEERFVFRDDPVASIAGRQKIGNAKRLTKEEVEAIISDAAERAEKTRAGIRLPVGTSAKVFITVVNNPNKAGEAPAILGIFRTGEATMFSWDVSAQKARTAVFFSNRQLAQSTRTVGFLAQRFYPPGLDGRPYGPYFGFQEAVSLRRSPAGAFPGNPNLPNGITIFPGGFPLYRDGYLVGAIGVSGDGVDQDDIISSSGCEDFLPNRKIRADQYTYRGARLPFVKFPRDPER